MLRKLLVALVSVATPCCAQMLSSQAKGSARAQIAMLSTDGGCAAGIIVGTDATRLLIATAAHVIPDISAKPLPRVLVHLDGGIDRKGTFLTTFDPPGKGDLAVIAVPRDATIDSFLTGLDFAILSPDASVSKDSHVYSVGCSGGSRWSIGADETLRSGAPNLLFDSAVTNGQSGGGLFNNGWELVGMPFLADGTHAQAHSISELLERVKQWKLPVTLKARAATNRVADSDTVAQEARAVTLEDRAQTLLKDPVSGSELIAAYAMIGSRLATPRQTRVMSQAWNAMERVAFVQHLANYHYDSDDKDYSDDPFHGERVQFSSPVVDRAVSLRTDRSVVVWDAKGEKPRLQIAQAEDIALGPDGAIATFGRDNRLVLWSSEDGRRLESFTAPSPVVSAAFNADGRWLAVESSEHTVSLWNRSLPKATARFNVSGGPHGLRVCEDGALVGVIGSDGSVKVYSREKAAVIVQLPADTKFADLQFMPECAQMVISDRTGAVRIASTKDGSEIAKIPSPDPTAQALTMSPDGRSMVFVSHTNTEYEHFTVTFVSLIDRRSLSWLDESGSGFNSIAFTADGKGFLLFSHAQSGGGALGFADLYLLDIAGRENQVKFAGGKVQTIAFDDVREQLEVATADGQNQELHASNRSISCTDSCQSPNGKWKLTADDDGFDLQNLGAGTKAHFTSGRYYDGNFERPSAMAISPDGSTLAIGVSHGTGVFDLSGVTAQEYDVTPAARIAGDVTSLAFSPNGKLLAIGSVDGTVQVVGVPQGEVRAVTNAGPAVTALVIANDGKFAAADEWGRIKVWDASIETARKRLCDSPGSNVPADEWTDDPYLNVQPLQLTCENWPSH